MEDITKGRILLCFLIIFTSIFFGYVFLTEFVDYPIVYIYTISAVSYIPVMLFCALIISFKDQEDYHIIANK